MSSEQRTTSPSERPLAERVKLWAGIAAAALLLLFLLQNLQEATIHFLWFDWEVALILALLLAAIVGGAATWLLTTFRWRRRRESQ